MKNLLACLAVFAAFSAGAQSMPYNPDANDDGYIGGVDLLGLLPLYGQQFGVDSSLTCDYDGTPIEEFFGNVWNGDIVIDSILVQYDVVDSAQVYIAGCPDPVWEVVSYERAWTAPLLYVSADAMGWVTQHSSYQREFQMEFSAQYGWFRWSIYDYEVSSLGLDEVLGYWRARPGQDDGGDPTWHVPFPPDVAFFDESGVEFVHWLGFLSGATYVNILPYWHYAE